MGDRRGILDRRRADCAMKPKKKVGNNSARKVSQPGAQLIDLAIVRRAMRASVAGKVFGFELDSLKPGRAVMSMRVRGRHLQLHGMVHGGLFAALADTAGAIAAYPMLPH